MNIKKLDLIIEYGCKFINDNPRIIKTVYRNISYNDEPKLFNYGVYFKDRYINKHSDDAVAAGVSFDKKRALLKVLGETIERYSLGINNNDNFVYSSYNNLINSHRLSINPQRVNLLQLKNNKDLLKSKMHWIKSKSLLNGKDILIPAQLVYVPYLYSDSDPILQFPSSTGAAAGSSLNESIYRGICEVAERDAFMISYLNKLPSPRIDLSSINDPEIRQIIKILNRYKLELVLIDLTTDLKIPVIATITLDRTRIGPSVSLGLKAGFNTKDTIIGSIEESLMVRSGTRDQYAINSKSFKGKNINTIEDRAYYWFSIKNIEKLNFWLRDNDLKKIIFKKSDSINKNLEKAINILRHNNLEFFYVDITAKELRKYNIVVVKVIIPELQPLYLDERFPYLETQRLYKAPVIMGYLSKANSKNTLNKIPHPFL